MPSNSFPDGFGTLFPQSSLHPFREDLSEVIEPTNSDRSTPYSPEIRRAKLFDCR
jgi:hypothetical protein